MSLRKKTPPDPASVLAEITRAHQQAVELQAKARRTEDRRNRLIHRAVEDKLVRPSVIADELGLTRGRITAIVKALEDG